MPKEQFGNWAIICRTRSSSLKEPRKLAAPQCANQVGAPIARHLQARIPGCLANGGS
jgi:hypothetical protein